MGADFPRPVLDAFCQMCELIVEPFGESAGHAAPRLFNERGEYRFMTVHPGAYPWTNHHNAWRPSHIHFSLFGNAFISRLVTQMYFPGDPLLDPIPFADPVVLLRPPLRVTFAYSRGDATWTNTWQGSSYLPAAEFAKLEGRAMKPAPALRV